MVKIQGNGLNIPKLEEALASASPAPWTAYRLIHEDRGDDMTPDEVGQYAKNSVVKSASESGSSQFLAILVQKSDGPADVCHVGNGPTSPANATAIAEMRNQIDQLIADARTVTVIQGFVLAIREGQFGNEGLVDALNELFPADGARPTWPNPMGPH